MEEVELRYRVPRCSLAGLCRLSALGIYTLWPAGTLRMVDIYLDTSDALLERAGYALRLRFDGNQWLATLKGTAVSADALVSRTELEIPLPKSLRNPERWPASELKERVLQITQRTRLRTITQIRQKRDRSIVYRGQIAIAELSLDRVDFGPDSTTRRHLLECELRPGGTRADLEMIDTLLARRFVIFPENRSKLQLAHQLLMNGEGAAALKLSVPRTIEELVLRYDIDTARAVEVSSAAEQLHVKLTPLHGLAPQTVEIVRAAAMLYSSLARLEPGCRRLGIEQLVQQPIQGLPDIARYAVASTASLADSKQAAANLDRVNLDALSTEDRAVVRHIAAIVRIAAALVPSPSQDVHLVQINVKPNLVQFTLTGADAPWMTKRLLRALDLWKQLHPTRLDIVIRSAASPAPPELASLRNMLSKLHVPKSGRMLAQLIEKLHNNAQSVRQGQDSEAVHDLRVTTRRLRSAISLMRKILPQDQANGCLTLLRTSTGRLGAVRDAEVLLELAADYQKKLPDQASDINQLILAWQQQRTTAREQLIEYLEQDEYSELEPLLTNLVTRLDETGAQRVKPDELNDAISRHIQRCLTRALTFTSSMDDTPLKELHKLRIHIKRLRYSLESGGEMLGADYARHLPLLVDMQTQLGTMHDYAVILDMLEPAGEPLEEYAQFRAYCVEQLTEAYGRFLVSWRRFTNPDYQGSFIALILCR
ncbi:MAG: CHAD domain-containing protein [Chloroflexi bacterium]|nr:CHAD domain-containing protein [Chloroflexota bacterium]